MKYYFFVIILIFSLGFIPITLALSPSVGVSIPSGTSTPGCETKDLCYIPSPLTVTVGTVVKWTNHDTSVHTVNSGSPKEGPDGIIYSDLISPGEVFAHKFEKAGTYPYFCMVHPWMEGIVIVKVASEDKNTSEEYALTKQMISDDGKTLVKIQTDIPKAKNKLGLEIAFTDEKNRLLSSMNYDIRIIQDGEDVLFLENENSIDGTKEYVTNPLESDNPVDVKIGLRGIYPTSEKSHPVEEVITFQKIPEFGEISILILVVSISALIALRIKPIMKIPQ